MARTAVIDLGSNSFRLVVYDWEPGGPWALSDEIREPVRISAHMGSDRVLRPDAVERAVATANVFASFCGAASIDDVVTVATSAIRDASNRDRVVARLEEDSGLEVRVLSGEEEAHYGYLAVVNSTTLRDGFALDMGGGSIQLNRVEARELRDARSLPLGAVRVSERFLPDEEASDEGMRALRDHAAEQIAQNGWWSGGGRMVGIGGSIRNLAAAAQKTGGFPDSGVQGFSLTRPMLDDLVAKLAARPASKRGKVAGIKRDRADVILGAALVLEQAMEVAGADAIEVSEAGLREGVFFERFLDDAPAPRIDDVRVQSVTNLARRYGAVAAHAAHVQLLSLEIYDGLAGLGLVAASPDHRELLGSACALHDIGMAIDYDDHHKHSRYLIRSAGLPGHDQRELELIALIARYHRKGEPSARELGALARDEDEKLLALLSGIVRVAEQLERARDQSVGGVSVARNGAGIALTARTPRADSLAIWSAQRASPLLAEAIGLPIEVRAAPD